MILQKRIDKLEELYKKNKGLHLVLAFIENELDKIEIFSASNGKDSSLLLFSGVVPEGREFLKTIEYQYLVEIPGPKEWAS